MKQSSWSKPQNNNVNYIARRKVVNGLFERGTAIANEYKDRFIGNLSQKLKYSSGVNIKIIVDNKEFTARIDRPKSHSEESRYIRMFFKKELKDYLNNKVKDELNIDELYLDFYVGDEKDTFKLEVVNIAKLDKFIFTKEVDKSTLTNKVTVPVKAEKTVLSNLSITLEKGKGFSIKIINEERTFNANIIWPDIKDGRDVIQIGYGKDLRDFFIKEFKTSYDEIINKGNKVPDELKEYIEFYLGEEKDTFIVKLIKSPIEAEYEDELEINESIEEPEIITDYKVDESIDFIHNYITSQGYTYNIELIKNIYLSLKTKPFLILSGISGTGKSKIIELFARALGATAENKRFNLIPVKPDWSDSTDLLGYRNIEGHFIPGIITKICKEAMENKNLPYFIVLDEMNLARVEYYFSDILSLMETRRVNEEGEIITNNLLNKDMLESTDNEAFIKYGNVYIPENVYIVGTVNMDETTFPFSRKVLDRANTIEFNKVNLNYDFDSLFNKTEEARVLHNDFLKSRFLKIKDCSEHKETALKTINELIKINNILEKYNFHFAYRVRDEIVFYMIYAREEELLTFHEALDNCIVQKILPKINGSSNECFEVLLDLFEHLNNTKISNRENLDDKELNELEEKAQTTPTPLATEKLLVMIRRFIKDGFTTFW